MKAFLSFLLFSIFCLAAQAQFQGGNECGLIESADEFQLSNEVILTLTKNTKLSPLQEKQILAATPPEFETAQDALSWLIESSEAGDVYYETGEFQGKTYNVIRYYPGGNPYGTIFKLGETTPLADIADSDIICSR